MIPDAECVRIVAEILQDLKLHSFVIKVWFALLGTPFTRNSQAMHGDIPPTISYF